MTNEIIQFSEQKLIDKNRCEWSFSSIAPATSMLRKYDDAVGHILLFYLFRLRFLETVLSAYSCKITNSKLRP